MSDVDTHAQITSLVDEYHRWLKDKTILRKIGDWTEITSPLLDRNNDMLQVYASKRGDEFVLSDDGVTIGDLESSGMSFESQRRKDILNTVLAGFGVRREGDALTVRARKEDFSLKKHNILQAMLAVGDMFFLSRSVTQGLFFEDVEEWLTANEVRYVPRVKFAGKSGFDNLFHFVIPRFKSNPERVIQAISNPTKSAATALAFAWIDTAEAREKGAVAYAILNDNDRLLGSGVRDALTAYGIRPVPWSQRQQIEGELAA